MTNNIMKKLLRMLGMVWSTALTILVFAVLLLKVDLVLEIMNSRPVVAVCCIVAGVSLGFIAGFIICYLSTSKLVDAKDAKIRKLQNKLDKLRSDYAEACAALSLFYTRKQNKADSTRGSQIFSQIENFSVDSEESAEESTSENLDLQEDDFEDVESSTESKTD